MLGLGLFLTTLATQFPPPPSQDAVLEDVVVVGSREAPLFDVFDPFVTLCFDGNRRDRKATAPDQHPLWVRLDDMERDRLGLTGDLTKAYKLEIDRVSLVLKIDEQPTPGGRIRNTCVLTIVGDHDPDAIVGRMARLFRSPGTQDHVGKVDGYQRIAGWEQWAWTAIPNRRTSNWEGFTSSEGAGYVVVVDPGFYSRNVWVVGDLKYRAGGEMPVTELSLTHYFKP